MLEAIPQSVFDLRQRTRARNRSVWAPILAGTILALDEATLNALYLDTIEAPVAIADEVMAVKEYERDQSHLIAQQQAQLGLQEVLDGFGFVQSKLADLYVLWQIKDRVMGIKIKSAYDLIAETYLLLTAELAGEALQLTAIQNEQTVLGYEKVQSQAELAKEQALKNLLVNVKEALQDAQALSREELINLRTQMELLVNAAKQFVAKNRSITRYADANVSEKIAKLGTGESPPIFLPQPNLGV